MVIIKLTFPGGRYHATPWGRHVNEGAVEWPPCPWRLIRALIAVYWRKGRHLAEPESVQCLVERLAAAPPHYALPEGAAAHTRHYMPPYKGNTTKVFDAFFHVAPGGCVHIGWPGLELEENERALLGGLLGGLGYLGRAESWTEAELLPTDASVPEFNAAPAEDALADPPTDREREQVLCPMTPEAYTAWRDEASAGKAAQLAEAALAKAQEKAVAKGRDPKEAKLTPTGNRKIESSLAELFPNTLFDALHADTGDLHKQGWRAPPGSSRIAYYRPPLEKPRMRQAAPRPRPQQPPCIVRFVLASDTAGADVRPRIEDTLYLGENVRRALMSQSRKLAKRREDPDPRPAAVFSGKDREGNCLAKDHAHAHILPCDDDGDGRIDHVIVYAPMGFSHDDLAAMSRLRRLWQHGGRPGLLSVLVGQGEPADFGGFNTRDEETPALAESAVWCSVTPFVLPRHPKRDRRGNPKRDAEGRWVDGPEMQLCAELERRGLPRPVRVECYAPRHKWRHFATRRKNGGGTRSQGGGMGFTIEFAEPVRGPIALGYGCHFGLGLFVPQTVGSIHE